jgi:peptidoglycan/xylan/chitin deacetylase (PgdA/CDA1 family)
VLRNQQRVVSITFDDGFRNAADIAVPILAKYGFFGTFYVVTGWVEPAAIPIDEPYNKGRPHGNWVYWRQMSNAGHEVGSHSFSHLSASGFKAAFFPWLMQREVERSFQDLQREIPCTSYTMSMPWNAATKTSNFFVRRRFSACRLGSPRLEYNVLDRLQHIGLRSWAPSGNCSWSDYLNAIQGIPNNGWLILQFHSFGDEGWEPVSPDFFDQLCALIAMNDIHVATVRDVVKASIA